MTYRKKDSYFYALCLLSLPVLLVPLVLHFTNQPIKVDLLQYGVTGHDKEMLIVWNPGALSLRCGAVPSLSCGIGIALLIDYRYLQMAFGRGVLQQ